MRKSGWLIFISITAALLALIYLFIGPALRLGMIYSLEKVTGAEVNIAKVSVQLAPLALKINKLQLTDPAAPEYNSFSFNYAVAALEVWPAMLGYYVINDLEVIDAAYGSKRAKTGEVYRQPNADGSAASLADLLKSELPTADELLARVDLKSPAKAQALQDLAAREQTALQKLPEQLPNKASLAKYQADIKALTESKIEDAADLAKKTAQLKQLKEQLLAEKERIMLAKQQLEQSKDKLQLAVAELQQASTADWQKAQQLANLSDGGLAGISQILLGQEWADRLSQLNALYQYAQPYLPVKSDSAAEDVVILPNRILPLPSQPYPDFWVKNAQINWLIGGGNVAMSLQDITAQHNIIDKATKFALDATDLPQLKRISLNGDFAILQQMVTNLNWQLDGLQVQDMLLGKGENALALASSLVSSNGKINLTDKQLIQHASLALNDANFTSVGNKYLQQLASILNQQTSIPLTIDASGLISAPDVSIRSSLDKLLGDALLGEAKQKIAALQADLKTKLDGQLQSGLAGQADWSALLSQQSASTEDASANIEQLLAAKLADFKDQAKDKLKDRLKDKFGGGN
ncbi:TIGR03545 family protein [Rheinheimera salexigens]|uniref:TIGR03545 family protein n=1 Tax=Rheinheimera salexigens TaxID=1628148 RepID=A0A1E7QAH3_9GAMM|nr:TIGR03545 family protein [Rheinheimera salexigens]